MSNIVYDLYKEPIQLEILAIVKYLYANKIVLVPKRIIERNHTLLNTSITTLPTIVCGDDIYSGIHEVIRFYEEKSGIQDLLNKALEFKLSNPDYRIRTRA